MKEADFRHLTAKSKVITVVIIDCGPESQSDWSALIW